MAELHQLVQAAIEATGESYEVLECDPDLADIDQNGRVDAFDIEPFIDLLFP